MIESRSAISAPVIVTPVFSVRLKISNSKSSLATWLVTVLRIVSTSLRICFSSILCSATIAFKPSLSVASILTTVSCKSANAASVCSGDMSAPRLEDLRQHPARTAVRRRDDVPDLGADLGDAQGWIIGEPRLGADLGDADVGHRSGGDLRADLQRVDRRGRPRRRCIRVDGID